MDGLLNILNMLSNNSSTNDNSSATQNIPKEILDQYPYGEFPIRYTKVGQENIRKNSENRYSYDPIPPQNPQPENNSLNIASLIPIIELLSSKHQPKDMMKIFTKLLFKDNKDMQKLFDALPNIKSQEIGNPDNFPDTNKVNISTLKRIN